MAGPTPVSALIHAATMVTAGVYLMVPRQPDPARASPWRADAHRRRRRAHRAVRGHDRRAPRTTSRRCSRTRPSASSATCSWPSARAPTCAAIFHMITHAFFKALLFLGAGSVIHGMHDEQDMRRMGALRKLMPITAVTFIVGWLAIAGVPPFAGFWSKDEILADALAQEPGALGRRPRHRAAHRLLHEPPGVPGLLRRGALGRRTSRRARAPRRRRSPHESPWPMTACRSSCSPALSRSSAALLNLPFARRREFLERLARAVVGSASRVVARLDVAERHRRGRARSSSPIVARARPRHRRSPYRRVPAHRSQSRPARARGAAPTAGTSTTPSPRSWAARRSAPTFDASTWFDRDVIDGAVNGVGALVARRRRPAPHGCRPATCATTPLGDRRRRRAAARLVRRRPGERLMPTVAVPDSLTARDRSPPIGRRAGRRAAARRRRPELRRGLSASLASVGHRRR